MSSAYSHLKVPPEKLRHRCSLDELSYKTTAEVPPLQDFIGQERAVRAMQFGLDVLGPHVTGEQPEPRGRVVLGTVAGDLHDIGKNLVGMMMRGGGLEVVDLGIDVPPEKFVAAVREHRPHIVGLSALLTTTMTMQKQVIEALSAAGMRQGVKVMVGGAPVTRS